MVNFNMDEMLSKTQGIGDLTYNNQCICTSSACRLGSMVNWKVLTMELKGQNHLKFRNVYDSYHVVCHDDITSPSMYVRCYLMEVTILNLEMWLFQEHAKRRFKRRPYVIF